MGRKKKMRFLGFSRVLTSLRSCRSPNVGDSHSFYTPCISSPPPSPINQYQYPQNFPGVPVAACSRGNCRSFSRADVLYRKCDGDVNPVELIPAYLLRKEDKWHVVVDDPNNPSDLIVFSPQRSKIDSDDGGDLFPPLSIPKPSYRESKKATTKKKKVKKNGRFSNNNKKKTKTDSRGRASTSSADTRLFSSDEDENREFEEEYEFEDQETLIYSSNSLSTVADGQHLNRNRRFSTESSSSSSMSSMFLRRMKRISLSSSCAAGGGNMKVRDSFAVVKRSNDPYSDFRRSMLEMVIEKQIYDASDLEDLLRCFLSLNKDEHHKTIIRAFSSVRDGFFRS